MMKEVQSSKFKVQNINHPSPQSSPLMGEETVKIPSPLWGEGQGEGLTRRGFLGFFLLGGVISLFGKKVKGVVGIEDEPRKAMFWRKTDEY